MSSSIEPFLVQLNTSSLPTGVLTLPLGDISCAKTLYYEIFMQCYINYHLSINHILKISDSLF